MFSFFNKDKNNEKPIRLVLAGPEIAGFFSRLHAGFLDIGIDAELCTLPNRFDYSGKYSVAWQFILYRRLSKKRADTPRTRLVTKVMIVLLHSMYAKLFMPMWACCRFDVFLFGFGTTFSDSELELKIYRLFRKKIIFVFLGGDARASYLSGSKYPLGQKVSWDEMHATTKRTKDKIVLIERYADEILAAPGISHLFTRKVIDITVLGNPALIAEHEDSTPKCSKGQAVKILHGPSDPLSKGSAQIAEMINRLKSKGYNIEYMPVMGVTNAEMLNSIRSCDFVVDCLWADIAASTFASEAAFMGKPVIIGGYFEKQHQDGYLEHEIPPYICVEPDLVESAIEKLLVDSNYREALGARLKCYMMEHRRTRKIAEKYLQIISGDIPDRWVIDPYLTFYLHGYGMPEDHVKSIIRGFINEYGVSALQISDKPLLERAFIDFASQTLKSPN